MTQQETIIPFPRFVIQMSKTTESKHKVVVALLCRFFLCLFQDKAFLKGLEKSPIIQKPNTSFKIQFQIKIGSQCGMRLMWTLWLPLLSTQVWVAQVPSPEQPHLAKGLNKSTSPSAPALCHFWYKLWVPDGLKGSSSLRSLHLKHPVTKRLLTTAKE